MRKPPFANAKTKGQNSCVVTAQQIRALFLLNRSLYFPNTKFQASSYMSSVVVHPVCVGPGRKPLKQVFSGCGSYVHLSRSSAP